ncbi:MAG: S-adenosylmethionine:tRNA ribosyltransferase-isomerase [Bacteroidia bacterium]|nr:S-adenosylmethionine:tRNA ribosyltransferase-isomerase [Bacteroidia bacterium]
MTSEGVRNVRISDFDYELPKEMIAQSPLPVRDQSKLLVFNQGEIKHQRFDQVGDYLPSDTLLVFNNTKVIPARIYAEKSTGARIQIFLLNPVMPYNDVERTLLVSEGPIVWKCMIGNAKKWKATDVLEISLPQTKLRIKLQDREAKLVHFEWDGDIPFSEVLDAIGQMPLPPYIKREAQTEDAKRYQTVFAKNSGAVAAPTAGLHFSENVLNQLSDDGVTQAEVTLHVGAGTFKPVEVEHVWDHPMHEEFYQVDLSCLLTLMEKRNRIATGTTSLRTLETLYWVGIQLLEKIENPFDVRQHAPYEYTGTWVSYEEAIRAIVEYAQENGLKEIVGSSGIMIMPGYTIRSVVGLITNFHMPKSTLLLLISSLVGDQWRHIYEEAKANQYRFLSYGDSSLLIP